MSVEFHESCSSIRPASLLSAPEIQNESKWNELLKVLTELHWWLVSYQNDSPKHYEDDPVSDYLSTYKMSNGEPN